MFLKFYRIKNDILNNIITKWILYVGYAYEYKLLDWVANHKFTPKYEGGTQGIEATTIMITITAYYSRSGQPYHKPNV